MTFDRFLQEVAPMQDLCWRKYRRRSARHRVELRIRELGLAGFEAYLDLLRSDPRESSALADLMRVTVSRFFREAGQWRILAERILPELVPGPGEGEPFRAWSAGCCGGEEPYTLAMLWLEGVAPLHPGVTLDLAAWDIDEASLDRARSGRYDGSSLRELPATLRGRFFRREGGLWRVGEEVKGMVRLERRNVVADPLPSRIDLLLCRYLVFTYYRGERLLSATLRLWEALRPGGVLMVGEKESLPEGASAYFDPWPGCPGFYRRKSSPLQGRLK